LSSITISGGSISNIRYEGTAFELRIRISESFQASDGTIVEAGEGFYQPVTLSVVSGTASYSGFTIYSTADGINTDRSRYVFKIYVDGELAQNLTIDGCTEYAVPATPTTTTIQAIATYTVALRNARRDRQTTYGYSDSQIDGLINAHALVRGDSTTYGHVKTTTSSHTAVATDDTRIVVETSVANDDIIQRKSGSWVNRTLTQLKVDLALVVANISDFTAGVLAVLLTFFGKTVHVRNYATAGLGTQASPWTGWDTAVTWSPYTTYEFADGWYSYSTSPQFGRNGIHIKGGKNTFLSFTGTGVGFDFIARDMPTGVLFTFTNAATVENIRLVGNSNMTYGFDIAGVQQCTFRNLRASHMTTAGYRIRFAITCTFIDVRVTYNETDTASGGATNPRPVNDFLLDDWRLGSEPVQNNLFTGITAEGSTAYSIHLQGHSRLNTFIGGTAEGSSGGGVYCGQDTSQNKFDGMDFEANTGADWYNDGTGNSLDNILSASATGIVFGATSKNSGLHSGAFQQLTVISGAENTLIDGNISYNVGDPNPSPIVDNGTDTLVICFFKDLGGGLGAYFDGSTGFGQFIAPTLINSWTNNGGSAQIAGYKRTPGGVVTLRGAVGGGVLGSVIFTLPAGFRPSKFEAFPVVTDTGIGMLGVATTGAVSHLSGGTTSVYMNVSFDTH
jgi:hypothetical protein